MLLLISLQIQKLIAYLLILKQKKKKIKFHSCYKMAILKVLSNKILSYDNEILKSLFC